MTMPEQKPEDKWQTAKKMIGVCITCVGIVYVIVMLVNALSS